MTDYLNKGILGCLLIVLFASCEKKLDAQEFLEFMNNEENELFVEHKSELYTFKGTYMPLEFQILNELKQEIPSKSDVDSVRKEIDGLQYYKLTIKSNLPASNALNPETGGQEEYFNKLYYLLDYLEQDVFLIENEKDTLYPAMTHMERNYGAAPLTNVMIAFKNKNDVSDKTLIFDDRAFGMGRMKFSFKKETIDAIPKLKTKD